jgi:hypothetical protein
VAVDSEGVDGLVDEGAQPRIGREVCVDDDLVVREIAPATSAAGDRLERDGVAKRFGERDRRGDQVGVGVAGESLTGRLQRCRLPRGQLLDLLGVKDEHGLEERDRLAALLAGGAVALLDRHRRDDANRRLNAVA